MIIISNLFVPMEGNEVKKKDKKTDEDLEMENKLKTLEDKSLEEITDKLNKVLEEMILKNPDQWIWSHDRWK